MSKSQFTRVLVFTATYNESGNIEKLLAEIWEAAPDSDILVVDDNSPDGTGFILSRIAASNHKLHIVQRPAKLGLGTAHQLAMIYAIENKYDALITMDADFSHDPRVIPNILYKLSTTDVVTGSRYMEGGACSYDGYRKYVSLLANYSARVLLGVPVHEFTTSYRGFNIASLKKINLAYLNENGYSFFMGSLFQLWFAGLRIDEIPIHFAERLSGSSKIPKYEIFNGIYKLLKLFYQKLFGNKADLYHTNLISDYCSGCGSAFLTEIFKKRVDAELNNIPSEFRCSSMGHDDKPTVAKCLRCGLSQVPASERPANLISLYEDVVDEDYLKNWDVRNKTFSNLLRKLEPYLRPRGRLIEIGSYCGLFLELAEKQGLRVTGIEPSIWAHEYSRKKFGNKVIQGDFEVVIKKIHQDFDIVVSWDVIEHLADPNAFFKVASRVLVLDGILAFSTIDIDSMFAKLMGGNWPWIMKMHVLYFGSGSLERLIHDNGLEILKVESYPHYASIRYAGKKFCLSLPKIIGDPLIKLASILPEIIIPISLGDVKLYITKKIR